MADHNASNTQNTPSAESRPAPALNHVSADTPLYGLMGMGFMDCPLAWSLDEVRASDADVVVAGVPFDLATSGRPGARLGPAAVRQASSNLIWEGARWPWDFALEDRLSLVDAGNIQFKHGEPQTMVDGLEALITAVVESGKKSLVFGGDHYIALPVIRSQVQQHGPLALVHFDAHTDTYEGGSQFDHGTMFHHAVEEGLLDTEHSIQIGIRTNWDRVGHPFEVIDAAEVNDLGATGVLERIRQRVGDRPLYISFDIDALDPAFAPGTGTPVVGGLTTDCALKIARGMAGMDIRGVDLVEVAPAYDHAEVTALAAATLALEFLYAIASGKE